MQNTKEALKQDIKQEVMRELQYGNPGYNYAPVLNTPYPDYSSNGFKRFDAYDRDRIKQEIMYELADDMSVYPPYYPSNAGSYPVAGAYNETIADSIKNELLAEINARRTSQIIQQTGYGKVLSDQRLNRMINDRYRAVDNIRGDLRKELQSIHKMERRNPVTDPYTRSIAEAVAMEAREHGIPLEQVIQSLDGKAAAGNGLWSRFSNMLNVGQRKGFLWGIGAAAVAFMLWPSARNNLHSVAVRSVEGAMSWTDRARSFMGGANHEPGFDGPDGPGKDKPEIDVLQ